MPRLLLAAVAVAGVTVAAGCECGGPIVGFPSPDGGAGGAGDGGGACDAGVSCVAAQPNGATCTAEDACTSSLCVDGVCCESACNLACQRCNGATPGKCEAAPPGDPDPACGTYVCDANGACFASCTGAAQCPSDALCSAGQCTRSRPNGQACTGALDCLSGFCSDGVCCGSTCAGACDVCNLTGGVGTCQSLAAGAAGTPSCSPYVCSGNATCNSSCTSNAQCASTAYCDGNTSKCMLKLPNGGACTLAASCASGFCADGNCCDSACGGPCDACDVTPGTCTLRAKGAAGSPGCVPYLCDGTDATCPMSCSVPADCAAPATCVNNSCGKKPLGATCLVATDCSTGNCIDGYCCDTACAGPCDACNVAGNQGTCTLLTPGAPGAPSCAPFVCSGAAATCPGTCSDDSLCMAGDFCQGTTCVVKRDNEVACATANQCVSGICADGYCCNAACGAACDACDVAGKLGICSRALAGAAGNPSCAPYLCDGTSSSCASSCAVPSDCASGWSCSGGHCCASGSRWCGVIGACLSASWCCTNSDCSGPTTDTCTYPNCTCGSGAACTGGRNCTGGSCLCPFGKYFCGVSGTCIANSACCDDSSCGPPSGPGCGGFGCPANKCPAPGGTCTCNGQPACSGGPADICTAAFGCMCDPPGIVLRCKKNNQCLLYTNSGTGACDDVSCGDCGVEADCNGVTAYDPINKWTATCQKTEDVCDSAHGYGVTGIIYNQGPLSAPVSKYCTKYDLSGSGTGGYAWWPADKSASDGGPGCNSHYSTCAYICSPSSGSHTGYCDSSGSWASTLPSGCTAASPGQLCP